MAKGIEQGWVKIYRRFLQWEWYDIPEMTRLFLHLLLKANIKPLQWHGTTIPVGSLVTSRAKLAKETNLSERTIRTCITRLKSTNEIATQTTNGYTLITICKFSDYQCGADESDQPNDQGNDQRPTSDRPATDQRPTSSREYKNIYTESCDIMRAREVLTDEDLMAYYFAGNFNMEIESLCRQLQVSIEELKVAALEVLNDWKLTGEKHGDCIDQKKHFINHLRRKTEIKKAAQKRQQQQQPQARKNPGANASTPRTVNSRWADFKLPTDESNESTKA